MNHAKGEFEVKLVPQQDREVPMLGRMTIDKVFNGDLVANSQGQMLSAMSPSAGPVGYVAMERVEGTLGGKKGSFVLQHNASIDAGKQSLAVMVVPDSGTEDLTGIRGTLTIKIEEGKHFYEFEYSLP